MKMDPFIEAEEADGRSVKRCCELFEVSPRAGVYKRLCERRVHHYGGLAR